MEDLTRYELIKLEVMVTEKLEQLKEYKSDYIKAGLDGMIEVTTREIELLEVIQSKLG